MMYVKNNYFYKMTAASEALIETPRGSIGGENSKKRQKHQCFDVPHFPACRKIERFLKCRLMKRIFLITFLIFLFIFIGVPIIFRSSNGVQRSLLFLNFVNIPVVDYNKTDEVGLIGARNRYIESENKVKLGVWHTLPVKYQLQAAHTHLTDDEAVDKQYDRWMQDEVTVIYCHGNGGNRAGPERIELIKFFNRLNYHAIAFDYRGFADSSDEELSEEAVVEDTKAVVGWVKERVTTGHVFVWGHSLGTAIASHALAEMEAEGKRVSGLMLEAPFNNLRDELEVFPLTKIYSLFPWFDFFFAEPLYDNNLRFESDRNLKVVSCPILILHAEDDSVVPYRLGNELYNTVRDYRKNDSSIELVTFESYLEYNHKFIYKDERLPSIVKKFVEKNLSN